MPITLLFMLAQVEAMRVPSFFLPALMVLLIGGALGWLIAAVLGFSRAPAFGAPARWFALSAACLVLYHLQWVVFVIIGTNESNMEKVLGFGAFFNLFVTLASICAIIGFMRLTNPRP
ncbi:MAG TPA: hypothetical protein VF666_11045 [Pyrinomonadaceae bacterium]|jgi:hypothetical protein